MEESKPNESSPIDPEAAGVATFRLQSGPSFRFYRGKSITLELSGEVKQILFELMNRTTHGPEELFIKGLLLYKAAVDAADDGKRVAILDENGEIDQEISGF